MSPPAALPRGPSLAFFLPHLALVTSGAYLISPPAPRPAAALATAAAALALVAIPRWLDQRWARGSTLVQLAGPAMALGAGWLALAAGSPRASALALLANLLGLVAGVSVARVRAALQPLRERELVCERSLRAPSPSLKPGETFSVSAGQLVGVDATVVGGDATLQPWPDSILRVRRTAGEAVLAGARVVSGQLQAIVRWTGDDRAAARLTRDPNRRADQRCGPVVLAARVSQYAALFAGGVGASIGVASGWDVYAIAGAFAAATASLASVGLSERVSLLYRGCVLELQGQGVFFRQPEGFDRLGQVSSAVLCPRGTLLRGQPDLASVESTGAVEPSRVLALAAAAFSAAPGSSYGRAVRSGAAAQGLALQAVRSAQHRPGLGVTAVTSEGRNLAVGTRALLLEERLSVAKLEGRISELESLGRSVLLVALGRRVVGVIALQDRLKAGARGAVARLQAAGVEPILVSEEARLTCEALARSTSIQHLRPEIPPDARAEAIAQLAASRSCLAVIGRRSDDSAAMAAGGVSVNLDSEGAPLERWDVEVTSGALGDAARAIEACRSVRDQARFGVLVSLAAAAMGSIALTLGAPTWGLPLASLAGIAAREWGLRGRLPLRVARAPARLASPAVPHAR